MGGELVEGSPATAQAAFDSLGESTAYASLPYPGSFIATLPGTINGFLAGKAPPVPPYPFYVASSYPVTPTATASAGPYGISATSTDASSTANAEVAVATGSPQVASANARATTTQQGNGTLAADTSDDIEGLAVGSLLRIGSFASHLHAVLTPGMPLAHTSSLQIGATVAGIPIGLSDRGLDIGAQVPPGVTLTEVTSLLKAAGIDLTYLPARVTPTSIESAALEIATTQQVPSQGAVTSSLILGRVSVTVQGHPVVETPQTSGLSLPQPSGGVAASGPGVVYSGSGVSPISPALAPEGAPLNQRPLPGPLGLPAARRVAPLATSLYLVVILAAAAVLGCSRLTRLARLRDRPSLRISR